MHDDPNSALIVSDGNESTSANPQQHRTLAVYAEPVTYVLEHGPQGYDLVDVYLVEIYR